MIASIENLTTKKTFMETKILVELVLEVSNKTT